LIYLAYITVIFFGLRFLVSLVNLIFSPVLKKRELQSELPAVSVLIPARNEEKNIENLLNDLLHAKYKNLEIIVFNDQSTDNTARVVQEFAEKDARVRLINSNELPAGWLGKNFACHKLAHSAIGEYLLFLDADVRIKPEAVESALVQMQKYDLKLLSIFPRQIMHTFEEKITVPSMNNILLSLLPLILTRISSRPSLSAANGQFMLFESNTYKTLIPHQKVKEQKVEDILISRLYKRNNLKIQCMTGNRSIQCRMYTNYNEAVQGFSRSVSQFFGGSNIAAAFYWLIGTFGTISVLASLNIWLSTIIIFLAMSIKIMISISSKQNIMDNLFYGIIQQLVLGHIILRSYLNKKRKAFEWKGRVID